MRNRGLALVLALSVSASACVQMKQYADVQFTPPQGDYKLLVLRPDVTVGSLTTGGMVEPRADWIDQARASITAAIKAQQGTRGGKVTFVERRTALAGGVEHAHAEQLVARGVRPRQGQQGVGVLAHHHDAVSRVWRRSGGRFVLITDASKGPPC